jgi:hypothetical protein
VVAEGARAGRSDDAPPRYELWPLDDPGADGVAAFETREAAEDAAGEIRRKELPGFEDVTASAIRSGAYLATTDLRDRQARLEFADRLSVRQRGEIGRMRGPRDFGPP